MELSQVLTIIKLYFFIYFLQMSRTEQLQTALDLVERGVNCVSRGRARSLNGGCAVFDKLFIQARTKFYFLQHKLCYFLLLYIQQACLIKCDCCLNHRSLVITRVQRATESQRAAVSLTLLPFPWIYT